MGDVYDFSVVGIFAAALCVPEKSCKMKTKQKGEKPLSARIYSTQTALGKVCESDARHTCKTQADGTPVLILL